ncbi:hypothetical protein EC957_005709 [Mortierella hygrophila]|uniref:Uncharacterized protein n=1 Tax=Mortierella hygrophila TaxID=979708 RepID=A0A9P6FET0_9FUNG|nr:hypothetical protein EC957_005709 [Mortierella hygrophila]
MSKINPPLPFITRYTHKLDYFGRTCKDQAQAIRNTNGPSQDQEYRGLYLTLGTSNARIREVEDKIEDLFRINHYKRK